MTVSPSINWGEVDEKDIVRSILIFNKLLLFLFHSQSSVAVHYYRLHLPVLSPAKLLKKPCYHNHPTECDDAVVCECHEQL